MSKINKITDPKRIKAYINDQLVQKKIIKGHSNYQKFIILSDYRSGSNFLMNLLKSHPNVVCYSELFYGKRIFWASKVYGKSELNKNAVQLRSKNPLKFLNKYCYRRYSKNINAVGFKLMYHDLYRKKNIDLDKLLEENTDIKVIHLIRKNQLERVISTKMLGKTGVAVAVNEKNWKKDNKIQSLRIEPEELKSEFKFREFMIDQSINTLRKNNNESIEVYYEDLNNNKQKVLDDVTHFLNLTNKTLETKQIKQNQKRPNEIVENYEDLKNYFSETEYEKYFD